MEAHIELRGMLVGVRGVPSTAQSVLYSLPSGEVVRTDAPVTVYVRRCTYANASLMDNSTFGPVTPLARRGSAVPPAFAPVSLSNVSNTSSPLGSSMDTGATCFSVVGVFVRLVILSLSRERNESVVRSELLSNYSLLEQCVSEVPLSALRRSKQCANLSSLVVLPVPVLGSSLLQRTDASGVATFALTSAICSAGPSLLVPVLVRDVDGVFSSAVEALFSGVSAISYHSSLLYSVHAQNNVCSGSYALLGANHNATNSSNAVVFGYIGPPLDPFRVFAQDTCGAPFSGSAQLVAPLPGGWDFLAEQARSVTTTPLTGLSRTLGFSGVMRVRLNHSVGTFAELRVTTNISRYSTPSRKGVVRLQVLLRMDFPSAALLGTALALSDLAYLSEGSFVSANHNATHGGSYAVEVHTTSPLEPLRATLRNTTLRWLDGANFSLENASSSCGSFEVPVAIVSLPFADLVPMDVSFSMDGELSAQGLNSGPGISIVIELSHAVMTEVPSCRALFDQITILSSRAAAVSPRGFLYTVRELGVVNCTAMRAVERNAAAGNDFSAWSSQPFLPKPDATQSEDLYRVAPRYTLSLHVPPSALYYSVEDEVITLSLPQSIFTVLVAGNTTTTFTIRGGGRSALEIVADVLMLLALPGKALRAGSVAAVVTASSSCYESVAAPLPLALHPLYFPLDIAGGSVAYLLSALVCNFLLFVLALLAHGLFDVAVLGYQWGSFPHYGLVVGLALFPGACIGGIKAVSMPVSTVTFYVLLMLVTLHCALLPVATFVMSLVVPTRWVASATSDTKRDASIAQELVAPSYVNLVQNRFLAVLCQPAGFYFSKSNDHARFRSAYDFYRGSCAAAGVVELLLPLLAACCYAAPCPNSAVGVLIVLSLHVVFIFVFHPRLSIGGNLLSLLCDFLCIAGVTLVLKGQEDRARTVFIAVRLFASTANLLDMALRAAFYVTVERHLPPPVARNDQDQSTSAACRKSLQTGENTMSCFSGDSVGDILRDVGSLMLVEDPVIAPDIPPSGSSRGRGDGTGSASESASASVPSPDNGSFGSNGSARGEARPKARAQVSPSDADFLRFSEPTPAPGNDSLEDSGRGTPDLCDAAMPDAVDVSTCIHTHTAAARRLSHSSSRSPPQRNAVGTESEALPQLVPHFVTPDGRSFARSDVDSIVTRVYVTPRGVCEAREWRPGSYEYDRQAAAQKDQDAATQLDLLQIAKKFEKRFTESKSGRIQWLVKEDEAEQKEEQALLLKLFHLEQQAKDRLKPSDRLTFAERRQLLIKKDQRNSGDEIADNDHAAPAVTRGPVAKRTWSASIAAFEYEML